MLAGLEMEHRHSIDEALRPIITINNGGLSVRDMPVKLVALVEPAGVNVVSGPVKRKAPECRAVLQPVGTKYVLLLTRE